MAENRKVNVIFTSLSTGRTIVINYDRSKYPLTYQKLHKLIATEEVRRNLRCRCIDANLFFLFIFLRPSNQACSESSSMASTVTQKKIMKFTMIKKRSLLHCHWEWPVARVVLDLCSEP